MGKYLTTLETGNQDPIQEEINIRKQSILNDIASTKRITYRQLNNNLESPAVYKKQLFIPEHHRIAYTGLELVPIDYE